MSVRPLAGPTDEPALAAIRAAGGERVMDLMERAEERLGELAGTGAGALAEHAVATIAAGGKRLRPLLVFIAAGECGGDGAGLVRAAVAVELVHSATLVHDDVLDAATLRRGRPTVVAAAGRAHATATGDFLFARAFSELALNERPDELRALSSAGAALAEGELLQRADAWNAEVPEARYLARCELKTARLFGAACALGALETGGLADELDAFGRGIGLAFQLLDDVLDVSGPPERTGKPRGADLLDGTVTLPLILARRADPELAALDLRSVGDSAGAAAVCERIAASGALEEVRSRALELVARAKAGLPDLGEPRREALELIADSVVERYS
jgi:geranylgeranyl pyrophosphate synthase